MRALIIREPYVSKILDHTKTWEMRGSATKVRGRIALIRGGSGLVVGVCDIVDVKGPLSLALLKRNARSKLDEDSRTWRSLHYGDHTFAWVLTRAKSLKKPVTYDHPRGAVIWVTLDATTATKVVRAAAGR